MDTIFEFFRTFWIDLQNGQLPELGYWNYLILSFLIILNGPAATLLGGAAASAGLLRPHLVFLAGITGNLIADIFWYNVGARGKTDWIVKNGRRIGIRQRHIDKISQGIEEHVVKILLMAKISIGLAVPTLLVTGMSRVPLRKWFPVVFFGESVWTGFLVIVGFYAGQAVKQLGEGIEAVMLGSTFLFLVFLVWLIPRLKDEKEELETK